MLQTLSNAARGFVLAALILAMPLAETACTPSQLQTAQTITQIAINNIPPVLQILVASGVLSTSQTPAAQKYATEATSDFTLVLNLIKDYKAQPTATTAQKIVAAINAGNDQLQQLLSAFHIVNPQKQAAFTGAVGLIIANMSAIIPAFPTQVSASAVKASNAAQMPSPKVFKQQLKTLLSES